MTSRPEPRRLLARDARRAQILRAAASAFSQQGFAATSMEDVARVAGITRLIVYRHFESKAELYRAILDEVAGRLRDEWEARLPSGEGTVAFGALLAVARELPDGFRLLFVHAVREDEFAPFAAGVRKLQLDLADEFLGARLDAGPFRTWVVRMSIDYLVTAVLEWMEVGDPAGDEAWLDEAQSGLVAMLSEWMDAEVSARRAPRRRAAPPAPR